jgi:1-deoxy-D-xylulose-5-phosphate synthase
MTADLGTVEIGKGLIKQQGRNVALLAFGTVITACLAAAKRLDATVVDMRFAKPLDEDLILDLSKQHTLLVSIEENAITGGAGSAVSEFLSREGILKPVLHLGLPDRFLEHGSHQDQLTHCGLDEEGIYTAIERRWNQLQGSHLSEAIEPQKKSAL